jgi:uncharacterized SAM-binding protein YcdF (DUF218 family)
LGAAIFAVAAGAAFSFARWRRVGTLLIEVGLIALWISATPVFANWLNYRLELKFPPTTIEALPRSDVVIVLGGVLGQPVPPRLAADLSGASDRILHALRIYRAGKASLIVISAGNLPWQGKMKPEAQLIADLLVELGVPPSALILETESRNTRENAVNTAALFRTHGWRSGILVSSGVHMPRAVAAFQKAGVKITPTATDVHAGPIGSPSALDLMPDVGALAWTTLAIKEIIGVCVYRYRGWA